MSKQAPKSQHQIWYLTLVPANQRKWKKKQFEEENEEHGFEKEEHGFDFLGHHFFINRSANEELLYSIEREAFPSFRVESIKSLINS